MKIRPVGAELFHEDGQTDRHDEANSRFRNLANAPKNWKYNTTSKYAFCVKTIRKFKTYE